MSKNDNFKPFTDQDEPRPWAPQRNHQFRRPNTFGSYAVKPKPKTKSRVKPKAKPKTKPEPNYGGFDAWRESKMSPTVDYFAFGSNMDEIQMKDRCPSAKGGRFVSLRGYSLTFCGFSTRWGGAVATIRPDSKGVVWGRVWTMSWADLRRLDGFEGHPFAYRRTLTALDDGSQAMVYIKPVENNLGAPSEEYFRTIARGYQQAELDLDKLVDAVGTTV